MHIGTIVYPVLCANMPYDIMSHEYMASGACTNRRVQVYEYYPGMNVQYDTVCSTYGKVDMNYCTLVRPIFLFPGIFTFRSSVCRISGIFSECVNRVSHIDTRYCTT